MSNPSTLPDRDLPGAHRFMPQLPVQIGNQEVLRCVNTSGGDASDRTCARLDLDRSPLSSKLQVLDITGYYLPTPLSLTQFARLKILRMALVDRDLAPGVTEWRTILGSLPELEELDLNFAVGFHYAGEIKPIGITPVVCDRLRNFKLTIEFNLCIRLLSRISIPNFTSFELTLFREAETFQPIHIGKVINEITRIFRERSKDHQQLDIPELYLGLTRKTTFLATRPLQPIPPHLNTPDPLPSFSILICDDLSSSHRSPYWPHSPALLLDLFNPVAALLHCNRVKSLNFNFLLPTTGITSAYQFDYLVPILTTLTSVEIWSINTTSVESLQRLLDPLLPSSSSSPRGQAILLPNLKELAITADLTYPRDTSASMQAVIDDLIARRNQWPGCCPMKKGRIMISETAQVIKPVCVAVELEEGVKVGCFGRLWARLGAVMGFTAVI